MRCSSPQKKKSRRAQPLRQSNGGTRKCAAQALKTRAPKRKPARFATGGLEPSGTAGDQEARGGVCHAAAGTSLEAALAAARSSRGRPCGCQGHAASAMRTQCKSGRICSQRNRPSVRRSSIGQRIGGMPRLRQSITEGAAHSANLATSLGPSSLMMSIGASLRHYRKSTQGIALSKCENSHLGDD